MRRLSNPTALSSFPTPGFTSSPGYFQEGNGTSVQGSIADSDWFNSMQEEMVAIAVANGAALDTTGNVNNQAITAINALIATASNLDLKKASNLSDLASAATARANLGVTATGADTTYAYRANNLSDLASAATARANLGLGTAATQPSGAFDAAGTAAADVAALKAELVQVTPASASFALGLIGSSFSQLSSVGLTAPCAGYIVAIANLNLSNVAATGSTISCQYYINGSLHDSEAGLVPFGFHSVTVVTAGTPCTVGLNVQGSATSPNVGGTVHLTLFFIPIPP